MKHRKTPLLTKPAKSEHGPAVDYVISMTSAFPNAPTLLRDDLPHGKYITLTDFSSLLRKSADRLLCLSQHAGIVVLESSSVLDLILSLAYVKDTSHHDLLGPDYAPEALRQLSEKEVRTGVDEAKEIIKALSSEDMSFEQMTHAIERTRNPQVTWLALGVIGPKAPVIQTSSGPLDLSTPDPVPRELHSNAVLDVTIEVIGGLNEANGLFEARIVSCAKTDYSLLRVGSRYPIRMVEHDHRTSLLVAQLFQSRLRAKVQADRVPLSPSRRQELKLVLQELESPVVGTDQALRLIAEQLHLDLAQSS